MGALDHDHILEIHSVAVEVGLSSSRTALLSGLPAAFVAHIPHVAQPSEQLLTDLSFLNAAGRLPDGASGLEIWLKNAMTLTTSQPGAKVFGRHLTVLVRLPPSPDHRVSISQPPNSARSSWLSAEQVQGSSSAALGHSAATRGRMRVWLALVSVALIAVLGTVALGWKLSKLGASPAISLEVDSSPQGARVVLVEPTTDSELGATPCTKRIRKPGLKTALFLRVTLEGYQEKFEELVIPDGELELRRFYRLEPLPSKP